MNIEDRAKIFLEYRKEALGFVRHYEDIRVKFSQLSITLTAALVGIDRIGVGQSNRALVPGLIIFLGVCGILVTGKYTERADRHATIARQMTETLSKMMDEKDPLWDLSLNYQEGARKHKEHAGIMARLRARYFWLMLHFGVVLLGAVMLARF
jgi:hypothetical protein